MKAKISMQQARVIIAIHRYITENGYSPSIRELCSILGLTSTATIRNHLQNLKELDVLDFQENKSRTIVIKKNNIFPYLNEKNWELLKDFDGR